MVSGAYSPLDGPRPLISGRAGRAHRIQRQPIAQEAYALEGI
jgi:hypothetical protein